MMFTHVLHTNEVHSLFWLFFFFYHFFACFYTAVSKTLCPEMSQLSLSLSLFYELMLRNRREKKPWRIKKKYVSSENFGRNEACKQSAVQNDSQFIERWQFCISMFCNRGIVRWSNLSHQSIWYFSLVCFIESNHNMHICDALLVWAVMLSV